jgi:hypothetical protein
MLSKINNQQTSRPAGPGSCTRAGLRRAGCAGLAAQGWLHRRLTARREVWIEQRSIEKDG